MIHTPLGLMYLIREGITRYYCYDDQTGKDYWFDKEKCRQISNTTISKTNPIQMNRTPFWSSLMLLILGTFGCTSSHLNQSKVNENAFPPGFENHQYVLLVQKASNGVNKKGITNYIQKSFKKNYNGKFEMIDPAELDNSPLYKDKNVYRFDIIYSVSSYQTQQFSNGRFYDRTVSRFDFHLFDRLENKSYPSLGVSSNVPATAINRTSVLLNKRLNSK